MRLWQSNTFGLRLAVVSLGKQKLQDFRFYDFIILFCHHFVVAALVPVREREKPRIFEFSFN